jgi:hypothetical protein
MAEDVANATSQIEALVQQLEALGIVQLQQSKKLGVFEKALVKVNTSIKKNPVMSMAVSLKEFAKSVSSVTRLIGNQRDMTGEEIEQNYSKLTIMQKLIVKMVAFGVVAKLNNKLLQKKNTAVTRLLTRMFSLVAIFAIVGFALAALSIYIEGSNSPVLGLTDNITFLGDAMAGLNLIISGEGDEGLAAAFDILAASITTAAIGMAVFNFNAGLVIGAITLAVGVFQLVNNETDSYFIATLAATSVAIGFATAIVGIKAAFVFLTTGTVSTVTGLVASVLGGLALLLAGLVGIYMYAQGAGEGLKGILLGVVSAILVAIGAVLLGFTMAGPVAIAAIVFFVFSLFRYSDEVKAFLVGAWNWLVGLAGAIWYGLLAGLGLVVGGIGTALALIVGTVLGIVNGLWTALVSVATGFWTALTGGGDALKEWFLSIPTTIKDGFISGFKEAFNAVIDIYNGFAGKMDFDIPNWVPKIGGETFSLPSIPKLAEGGIVTGPMLAMIGDNPSGKEAVIPLEKAGDMGFGGGGGMTVNINVGGVTDRTDKKQLAKEIGDLIRAEMSRGGRSYGNRRSPV